MFPELCEECCGKLGDLKEDLNVNDRKNYKKHGQTWNWPL